MNVNNSSVKSSKLQLRKLSIGGLCALAALFGSFSVSAANCPDLSQVIYTKRGDGANYTSRDQAWTGENPNDSTDYTKDAGFHSVTIKSDSNFVACSYEGKDRAGIRLTLNWGAGRAVSQAGEGWVDGTCRAQNAKECHFD
ncbi:DUF3757 domain-containing protein [Pseudomonas helmanticensis]|uniref:DUF3757 domain-containing protein n=1 Tax=Pseudomonas helmanticensis TaxID=1471381 RepID=UPI0010666EE4|nr:DUF3757 domain-containing protein [Pseudomonas helmanticensis]